MTTSSMAMEINNYAIAELSNGHYQTAYEALSYTVATTRLSDIPATTTISASWPSSAALYQYAWVDCTSTLQRLLIKDPRLQQGQYAPFLYLKFLLILPRKKQVQHQQEDDTRCCFGWVLAYNLGVITALMGRNIDKRGHAMLERSLGLLDVVQQRVSLELFQESSTTTGSHATNASISTTTTVNKHWSTLQLSIWNNQACVLSELATGDMMRDYERLHRLIQMGLTLSDRQASAVLDVSDQDRFHWTVQVLMDDKYAAAA